MLQAERGFRRVKGGKEMPTLGSGVSTLAAKPRIVAVIARSSPPRHSGQKAAAPHTVYECPDCGTRLLGTQRCPDRATFMTRIGLRGTGKCCDETITFEELFDNLKPDATINYDQLPGTITEVHQRSGHSHSQSPSWLPGHVVPHGASGRRGNSVSERIQSGEVSAEASHSGLRDTSPTSQHSRQPRVNPERQES